MPKKDQLIAIVLVRSLVNSRKDVKDTIKMLKLFRKNYCVVVKDTPSMMGMIAKAKDYLTWGEISEETLKMLLDKKAEKNPMDSKRTKGFFRLSPPRKGYGRKGIKTTFNMGGGLGYRGDKMNDLVIRMI